MNILDKKSCMCFFCIVIIFCVRNANSMQVNELPLVAKPSELNAEALFLVSSENGKILPIQENDWVLDIKKVCQLNDNIDKQLTLFGLVANGDSKSLVLHYNQKTSIDDIEDAPDCYWFPHVVINSVNKEILEEKFLLRISAFPLKKKQLWNVTDRLYETLGINANSIAILTAETLFEPMLTIVKNHHALMTTIDSNNTIMPLEIFEQSMAEIELLQLLINRSNDSSVNTVEVAKFPLNDAQLSIYTQDLEKVKIIEQSVNSRASAYQEVFGSFVKSINRTKVPIMVSLIDLQGIEQSGYEVWFVSKALINVERFHRKMGSTSPVAGKVTAGNYVFWAVQHTTDGKQQVVSNYRDLPIDDLSKQDNTLKLLFVKEQ